MPLFRDAAEYLRRVFTPAPAARPARAERGLARVDLRLGPKLPRRPDTTVWTDIVVGNWTSWDVPRVRDALDMHERGSFYESALLADQMVRDDRVAACLQTRVLGVNGLPFAIDASADPAAGDAAQAAREELTALWPTVLPEDVLAQLMRWAIVEGFALAEVLWETDGGAWVPQLKVWHPQHVYYRVDLRQYVALTMEGPVEITPGDGKWLLYAPSGPYRGWMQGVVRSLAIPYLLRQYAYRDWARYSEVHGLPIKGARVPASASTEDKQRFFTQLQALGAESVLLLPKDLSGGEFNLELIEAMNNSSWEAFERLILRCDNSVALAILGQNLAGGEVQGGSFAAAKVADTVRQDYKKADVATLAACLRSQLLEPWAAFNHGTPAAAPWPRWEAEPPEDLASSATTFKTAMEGATLARDLGAEVDMPGLVERYGLPLRATALPPPQEAPPAAAPLARSPAALARRRRSPIATARAGQVKIDGIADAALAVAPKAVDPLLRAVLAAVRASKDYDDLRARLVVLARTADTKRFEQLLRGAVELAAATGAWSATQETDR